MSVLEIARKLSLPGKGDELAKQLTLAIEELVAAKETIDIGVYRGIENQDEFTLLVSWTSVEAHKAWQASDSRARFRDRIGNISVNLPGGHSTLVVRRKGKP